MRFKRISIIGLGLLGGSIAAAVKAMEDISPAPVVVGFDCDGDVGAAAMGRGLIDRFAVSCADAVAGSDLVVICVPVSVFEPILREITAAGVLAAGCAVTDVGSTKCNIVQLADRIFAESDTDAVFVGSHPIAGSERGGLDAADAGLFAGRHCIVTPTAATAESAVAAVEEFWRDMLSMSVSRMSAEDHDSALGRISHLPHLAAALLMQRQHESELHLAGKGLLDTTRIAAGGSTLWSAICMANRQNLAEEMQLLSESAAEIALALRDGDEQAVYDLLENARKRRRSVDL